MFQKYNLLPTLTAADNIAIARHIAGAKLDEDPSFRESSSCWELATGCITSRGRFRAVNSSGWRSPALS